MLDGREGRRRTLLLSGNESDNIDERDLIKEMHKIIVITICVDEESSIENRFSYTLYLEK